MDSKQTEKATEQRYFDHAAQHRARHLQGLAGAPDAAAHNRAADQIRRKVARDGGATDNQAVAIGRIDTDDENLYIGRQLIRDDTGKVLVIGWQAPAAERYYGASRADPLGVLRKRTYECQQNTIVDFSDVRFAGSEETADEFLLRELGRQRTGVLADIVATIQAAQFDVIRQSPDQVLIIEGGPGTGKTVIALHRVSWLLNRHPAVRSDGVLVVGPHPTFIRYIREVLPGLGDTEVELRDLSRLAPSVQRGRTEPAPVARLKGDPRMATVLARALNARVGIPEPVERLPIDGRFMSIPGADIATILTASQAGSLPYADRRIIFRDRLVDLATARAGGQPVRAAALANLVDRLWPQQTAAALLHELLGSRRRLAVAAGDELNEAERTLLYRRGADRLSQELWSEADLPLLDELEHLLNGTAKRYSHVVADEAQDLSPMQLRSLARRSASGSMTMVGDIAQSTGPWARDNWDDVIGNLPTTLPARVEALRYGYRVPRQAYELAAQLLPIAAPDVRPLEVIRDGPAPIVHQVHLDERAGRSVNVAMAYAAQGNFVGIICPARCRREVEAALAVNGVEWSSADRGELGARINLVSPQEAKGLEFDAVVVVEPEHIVAEFERGHRMLYVALTRTTRHLDIVCVGEALPLSAPITGPDAGDRPTSVFGDREIGQLAALVAGQIRGAAPVNLWPTVLAEAHRLLDDSES